jgi:putative transposase
VWNILRRHGIDPSPRRERLSGASSCASRRRPSSSAISLPSTRSGCAASASSSSSSWNGAASTSPITAHPNGAWVTQQARNVLATLSNEGRHPRILIRDRDVKLTKAFDALFRSDGISVIRTPIAAPKAKAHAERWVGSVRRECLDRILIVSHTHLERVLREYVAHHTHRPHRALQQQAPVLKLIPTSPRRTSAASADATDSAVWNTTTELILAAPTSSLAR